MMARTAEEEEKRKKILEGSRALILREGMSSLTMGEIASRQGISKKTLYKYFSNKEQLVEETIEGKIAEIGALIEAASRDAGKSFPERLGTILGIVARQLAELGETIVKDVYYREPQLWEKIDKFRREHIFTAITRLFEEGIRDGWVRTDIESRLVPAMFVGAANAILNPSQIFAMTAPPVVIFDTLIRILLGGILTEQGRQQLFKEAKE
jgi:AcrR family transcriptional regulator